MKMDSNYYGALLLANFLNMFDQEENEEHLNHKFDIEKIDGTAFFTGFLKAFGLLYNRLCGEDIDALEFTHLLNKLVVQDSLGDAMKEAGNSNDQEA